MRKFDLSLRSSRSSYFATFRHQLTILSKTDALDEEKWLNMLGTFVKDWFKIGRAVEQECRDRPRMAASALKQKCSTARGASRTASAAPLTAARGRAA